DATSCLIKVVTVGIVLGSDLRERCHVEKTCAELIRNLFDLRIHGIAVRKRHCRDCNGNGLVPAERKQPFQTFVARARPRRGGLLYSTMGSVSVRSVAGHNFVKKLRADTLPVCVNS